MLSLFHTLPYTIITAVNNLHNDMLHLPETKIITTINLK